MQEVVQGDPSKSKWPTDFEHGSHAEQPLIFPASGTVTNVGLVAMMRCQNPSAISAKKSTKEEV
jgi:hypothetical protein